MPKKTASSDDWTSRYEDLRRRVLEEAGRLPRGPGVTVFVRRGLAAWMQSWPEEVPCSISLPATHEPARLPAGLVYDPQDRVVLDPDLQVQQALRTFFQAYERTGSAIGTVKFFRRESLLFPRRLRRGLDKGRLIWGPLVHSRALQVLHNPRYAGAFVFGRSRQRKKGDGHVDFHRLPPEEWDTVLVDAHAGYITWQQFQEHQQRLRQAAQKQGADRRHSPPGEGPALLQGLVMCGRCGQRMTVRYHRRRDGLVPEYVCQREGIERGEGRWWPIHWKRIGTTS